MGNSPEFVDYALELCGVIGPVRAKRMFGGHGFFADDLMFALIADDELYFKVDDHNRESYEALGLGPFRPFPDRSDWSMSYYPVPEDAMESPEDIEPWARAAFEAALRAPKKKKKAKKARASKKA